MERRTAWLSRKVIAVGNHVAFQLKHDAHLSEKRVVTIENGIDVNRFETPKQPDLREQLAPGVEFVILFVARYDRRKDHKAVVEAAHKLNQENRLPSGLRIIFLGGSYEEDVEQEVNDLIDKYDLMQVILRYPKTDDVISHYHMADCTILASTEEGFPNVLLESLACGRPAIVSEAANAAQIIEPGINGWQFETGNADQLASCILTAYETGLTDNLKLATKQRADRYRLEAMVDQYMQVYITG